jgi:chromosome partitioning protein
MNQIMKTITLLNEKGGVGKTTLATTLAAALARLGHTVVLMDADAQGNATEAFDLPLAPDIYDLMIRGAAWRDTLTAVHPDRWAGDAPAPGPLLVLRSNIETRSIPNSTNDTAIVYKRLHELRRTGRVDFVVIDTSPTPSMFHSSILFASDAVVLPTIAEDWSIKGAQHALTHIRDASQQRQYNNLTPIREAGIIPTMVRKRTGVHDAIMADIDADFADVPVLEPMYMAIIWAECALAKQSIFAYAPGSDKANLADYYAHIVLEACHEQA